MRAYLASFALVAAACGDNKSKTNDAALGDGAGSDAAGHMTLTLVDRPNDAAMFGFIVAFQDGNKAWQLAPQPTNDTYSLAITSSTWSVAWACTLDTIREVEIFSFGSTERTSLTTTIPSRCTDRLPPAFALSGTITNAPTTGSMGALFGTSGTDITNGTYSIPTLPGTHDLIVAHAPLVVSNDARIDSVAIQRGVAVAAATTIDVDFSTAMNTQSVPVTAVVAGAMIQAKTSLFSAGGTTIRLVSETVPPFVSIGLAPAQVVSGDVYAQSIIVVQGAQTAGIQDFVATVVAQSYTAPPAFGTAAAEVTATAPYPLVQTTWASYPSAIGYSWSATQTLPSNQCGVGATQACTLIWGAQQSPAVAGVSPTFTIPDLSGLAGWDARLQFQTGTTISGTETAATSSLGTADFPLVSQAAIGTHRTTASTTWSVMP